MILFDYEKTEPAKHKIGSIWNYVGHSKVGDFPIYDKGLTLHSVAKNGDVLFFQDMSKNWRLEDLDNTDLFVPGLDNMHVSLAKDFCKIDWSGMFTSCEGSDFMHRKIRTAIDQLLEMNRLTTEAYTDIVMAVLEAQNIQNDPNDPVFNLMNFGELRSKYNVFQLTLDKDYAWVLPQTLGEWKVEKNNMFQSSIEHFYVSEIEARAIAAHYDDTDLDYATSYHSSKIRKVPLNKADNGRYIPRTKGNWEYSLVIDGKPFYSQALGVPNAVTGIGNYASEMSLNEACAMAYEIQKTLILMGRKEVGVEIRKMVEKR